MPPKGSRRFNGKSRSGCSQCKRRRVKCDCVGPVCANCRRRQEHCSFLGLLAVGLNKDSDTITYPAIDGDAVAAVRQAAAAAVHAVSYRDVLNDDDSSSTSSPSTTTMTSLSTSSSSTGSLPPAPSLAAERLRIDEAELKHHFFTHAWHTFSLLPEPRLCDVWSRWIPQLATRHIFIRQIMLSLSAMHLCHLDPANAKRYYALAYQYSIQASNCFRLAVRDMSQDNWVLIVIFSMCNGIFGYYRPFLDERVMGIPCTMEPANSLGLMRVGGMFGQSIQTFLEKSPIRDKLRGDDPAAWAADPEDMAPRTLRKVAALERWMRKGGPLRPISPSADSSTPVHLPPSEATPCWAALGALATWVRDLPGGKPRMWCHFCTWPTLLPSEFIDLLRANHPIALMIYILWSEVMSYVPRRWFLVDWFERGLGTARRELAERHGSTALYQYWLSDVEGIEPVDRFVL